MTEVNDYNGPEWDELSQLLGAYLFQGWDAEYGDDAWDAVRDFRSGYPAEDVARTADQVRLLLDGDHDEAELDSITGKLGSYYHPPGDGWTYRGWLTELEKFLRADPCQG